MTRVIEQNFEELKRSIEDRFDKQKVALREITRISYKKTDKPDYK